MMGGKQARTDHKQHKANHLDKGILEPRLAIVLVNAIVNDELDNLHMTVDE